MAQLIKINGEWKSIRAVYKKVNGHWVRQETYSFDNTTYFPSTAVIDFNVFLIVAEDSYTGKQFYLIATLNDTRVYPVWTITSGNQYATINDNGKVSILSGVNNNSIIVRANYNGSIATKSILITYDNQLTIECQDTMTGTSGNVIAIYNSEVINPTWSITSGNQYATIDQDGDIEILNSGEITVQAVYNNYTVTRTITLVYDSNSSSQTQVDPDTGAITTTETTTTTDPETGATTETSTSTTTNADGSTSETSSETTTNLDGSTTTTETTTNSDGSSSSSTVSVSSADSDGSVTTETNTTVTNSDGTSTESSSTLVENEDGSSSSTSSTTNYDENGDETSSTESTTTVSAPDPETGSVTTQDSTTTTNADGTSSESTSTLVENTDGSSSSQSETTHYDENGDTTGSTTNQTTNNADGSSASTTTNYDAGGDPTDTTNVDTDTSGNIDTQNIEYDEQGNQTVVGYDINTDASEGDGKEITGNGVNTEFVPFDSDNNGFICHIRFKTVKSEQPRPPLVEDTDDSGSNWLYNIMSAKAPAKINNCYPGFDIRWSISKSNANSGNIQFRYAPVGETSTTSKTLTPDANNVYDITVTYDPHKTVMPYKLTVTSALGSLATIQVDKEFSALNMDFTLGYATSSQGQPYRHAAVTIYEFSIVKLQ